MQAEAGGTRIEALFVDEGFGTLDEDTLDEVMDVLDGLREGGRVVGLVSHVAELRARIPAQVHVRKTGGAPGQRRWGCGSGAAGWAAGPAALRGGPSGAVARQRGSAGGWDALRSAGSAAVAGAMTTPLRALALVCSLKPSPAASSTHLIASQVLEQLAEHDVERRGGPRRRPRRQARRREATWARATPGRRSATRSSPPTSS